MNTDSVVQEVQEAREVYAAQFGFDLKAIARDLKEQERTGGGRIVSFPPRHRQIARQAAPPD